MSKTLQEWLAEPHKRWDGTPAEDHGDTMDCDVCGAQFRDEETELDADENVVCPRCFQENR